jgi:hypothetical protein
MKKKKTKTEPKWGWVDDNHISILWNVDDVATQAKVMDIKLNKQQCREILDGCLNSHDANIGISWDILEHHIHNLYGVKND